MAEITTNTPAKQEVSASERFTGLVMSKYGEVSGGSQLTDRERRLITNYFICIDQSLAKAESERVRKNASNRDHQYDNNLAYIWKNINLPQLALDLAHYARIGLDMMEDNHLFPIPYKNNKAQLYDITLMEGYNGIRYQAEKYAADPPKAVTVEVIYESDTFRIVKKDIRNHVEGYEFEIPQPLNRGKPIGVFGYIQYDDPTKNKLVVFSEADVMKRKPKYASPEFWGGEKTVYENGKPTKTMLDGWVPEMFEKTMKREIYGSKRIPRDPDKIDESYQYIRQREQEFSDSMIEADVERNANREPIFIDDESVSEALPLSDEDLGETVNEELSATPTF